MPQEGIGSVQTLTLFLILRAFSSGCTAMTGIEAVANGVQAFKAPESRNANLTLTAMAGILLFLFVGTTYLTWATHLVPVPGQTVVSTLAAGVFGRGVFYYLLQLATALILVLAANTSYADFPRLGSFMAQDGYLPRQLKDRGSRLVYSNGMILLTVVALVLIVVFRGRTSRAHPALRGRRVHVVHALAVRAWSCTGGGCGRPTRSWRHSMPLNALGAVATFVVTIVIARLQVPARRVDRHRAHPDPRRLLQVGEVALRPRRLPARPARGRATRWRACPTAASSTTTWCCSSRAWTSGSPGRSGTRRRCVPIPSRRSSWTSPATGRTRCARQWEEHDFGLPLTILESPYRELIHPIRDYIAKLVEHDKTDCVTVILPEFIPESPVDYLLHDQTPLLIKTQLFPIPRVIVVDVPYHLGSDTAAEAAASCGGEAARSDEPPRPSADAAERE